MDESSVPDGPLGLLAKKAPQGKTARLRAMLDQVESLLAQGHSQTEVLDALTKCDPPLDMSIVTFRTLLMRLRKERSEKGADHRQALARPTNNQATQEIPLTEPEPQAGPAGDETLTVQEKLRQAIDPELRKDNVSQYFTKPKIGAKLK